MTSPTNGPGPPIDGRQVPKAMPRRPLYGLIGRSRMLRELLNQMRPAVERERRPR